MTLTNDSLELPRVSVVLVAIFGALLLIQIFSGCASLIGGKGLSPTNQTYLDTFDQYWQALDENYPYFGRLAIDWQESRDVFRLRAAKARSPSDFYHLLAGMLCQLNDPHVSLKIPRENWIEEGVPSTSVTDLAGFKILRIGRRRYLQSCPEGQEAVPPVALRGTERLYPEIFRVEGFPPVVSLYSILLRGRPGSAAEFYLRWQDGSQTRHSLIRPQPPGASGFPVSVEEVSEETGATPLPSLDEALTYSEHEVEELGKRFGVIKIETLQPDKFADADSIAFLERFDQLLQRAGQTSGLVLDLAGNLGGKGRLTFEMASRFLAEPFETFEYRSLYGGLVEGFMSAAYQRDGPAFDLPVVVKVDDSTASSAEHLARILQADAGAMVVGMPTLGLEAGIAEDWKGADGSILKFGSTRFEDRKGRSFQDLGVVPDRLMVVTIEEVRRLGLKELERRISEQGRVEIWAAMEQLIEARAQKKKRSTPP